MYVECLGPLVQRVSVQCLVPLVQRVSVQYVGARIQGEIVIGFEALDARCKSRCDIFGDSYLAQGVNVI